MSDRQTIDVQVEDLHKSFGDNRVLRGIDLTVRRGETMIILGGSGSGKSVLLKHINGLIRPDRGRVVVLGCDVAHLPEEHLVGIRSKVSYIFQQGALFDSLSVGENVAFPLVEHAGLEPREVAERVAALLARVGLPGIEDLAPADLSGGMRKRVALARGLALEPEVVLYDEPTAGLDPVTGEAIAGLIAEVAAEGRATSLVVTHDLALARDLGGRIAFLAEGRFAFTGSLEEASRESGALGDFIRAGGIHARS